MNVLVVGGTGHLGRPILRALLNEEHSVLSISSRELDLSPEGSENLEHQVCDTSETPKFTQLLDDYVAKNGPLDGIVSLASRSARGIDVFPEPDDFFSSVGDAALPTWTVLSLAHSRMSRGGSVVVVTSLWSTRVPEPKMYLDLKNEPSVAAVAGKAAQRQIVRYVAALFADRGIRVNMLTPGWFPQARGNPRPDYMNEIERRTPMGRIGKPEELVLPLLFLLGPGSSFITGQELVVDGGYSLW